jgi:hypothetical protein
MFKRMVVVLALAAAAPGAAALGMGPHWLPEYFEPPRVLDLVYFDVEDAAPYAAAGLQREAAQLLGTLGIEVRWRRGGLGVVSQPGELTVVLLARRGERSAIRPEVLGATIPREDGARAVWVYLPHVIATLGLDPERAGAWDPGTTAELGTALGRVVAHEVLHALAPGVPHTASGLMAERMGRAALTGPAVEVPAPFQQALRPALMRHASND